MEKIESHNCFNGELQVWEHESSALNCTMKFSIFLPDNPSGKTLPCITFLSGLTCTHENFTTKAGAYRKAAELGIIVVAPDTSPRGDDVPDDADSYDFGKGAGFYLNAVQQPWAKHYQMENYITDELNTLIADHFAVNAKRQSIMGHSMGGHGALTLYFKHPDLYTSVSAFSPIVAPTQVPWGQKAFTGYLGGDDRTLWKQHDACELVRKNADDTEILIDQGLADNFLKEQLKPELFEAACHESGQKLRLRLHEGYDHSYFFISTFIDDHLDHHYHYLKD